MQCFVLLTQEMRELEEKARGAQEQTETLQAEAANNAEVCLTHLLLPEHFPLRHDTPHIASFGFPQRGLKPD